MSTGSTHRVDGSLAESGPDQSVKLRAGVRHRLPIHAAMWGDTDVDAGRGSTFGDYGITNGAVLALVLLLALGASASFALTRNRGDHSPTKVAVHRAAPRSHKATTTT